MGTYYIQFLQFRETRVYLVRILVSRSGNGAIFLVYLHGARIGTDDTHGMNHGMQWSRGPDPLIPMIYGVCLL